jgi:hypothetical protein
MEPNVSLRVLFPAIMETAETCHRVTGKSSIHVTHVSNTSIMEAWLKLHVDIILASNKAVIIHKNTSKIFFYTVLP